MPAPTKRDVIASLLRAQRKGAKLTGRGNRLLAQRGDARIGTNMANMEKRGLLTARGKRALANLREKGLAPKPRPK